MKLFILTVVTATLVGFNSHSRAVVTALPPPEDTPEEILRTQIITEARSPIDGKYLSAAEYAELQTQLQEAPPPILTSRIREQIFLLRIRKTLLEVFPFLDL
ncbi:MAG: hypothetical protein KME21_09515 [Desmonostoc vinosum HA7617-LM4]|jgi:hypothetical protein|nr:hypothetical protein [Desmonostoc vinosum HA7617-LM4]